jgi:aminoglycoside 3-N-acetyltransferase
MPKPNPATVDAETIADGLRRLGLDKSSSVLVHASLRSFGRVDGGADAVCRALVDVCGTVLMTAGTWDLTGVPAPPGLVRPNNACHQAASWPEFDAALDRAAPFTPDLPVDRWLGRIAEVLRNEVAAVRGCHPLFSYVAVGHHASALVGAQRIDWPLGPIEALGEIGGDVVLLGVSHTSSTTIHLAEQHLGRSRFYRYAKAARGAWMELPNVPGESHRFDDIDPVLASVTRETVIGRCRARRVGVTDVLSAVTQAIETDPAALLCDDAACRCGAAYRQRLAVVDARR